MKPAKMLTILVLRSKLLRRVALVLALALILCQAKVSEAGPMGTAFTYQGHLYDANHVADGLYDFQFKLYDANTAGSQIGSDVNKPDVDVIAAYFTVELDFGSVFEGDDVWLQIGVRPGELEDPNVYIILSPRQEVTPTPYSLHTPGLSLTDTENTLVGVGAGENNTASYGTFVGYNAGYNNQGNYNTFVGDGAGYTNTTGLYNTFLGTSAGYSNTTSGNNVFIGYEAGSQNIVGTGNIYLGTKAGQVALGSENVFIGMDAGKNITAGGDNVFIGWKAGVSNTKSSNHTFVGEGAGYHNTTANCNTFIGQIAGYHNETGAYNTYLGAKSGYNATGGSNVFLGYKAGYYETGSNKLFIDNDKRANRADAREKALIYGVFDADPANQILTINGNVGIGTTSPAYKLDVEGDVQAHAYYTGDIFFQKDGEELWRMFEDEDGLYLENLKTGKVYSFVLQETENKVVLNEAVNLEQAIKDLQVENQSLKQRLEAWERTMEQYSFVVAKEAQQ